MPFDDGIESINNHKSFLPSFTYLVVFRLAGTMAPMTTDTLEQAYRHCIHRASSHYENFPVASVLLPAAMRRPVAVIYSFARVADDLADEGDTPATQRLQQLEDYEERLQQAVAGHVDEQDWVFVALADVIQHHKLPVSLFQDLLSAFRQDVEKTSYASFSELMDYCRRSADPVGRLLLHLQGHPTPLQLQQSDRICSALQIINFLQDLQQDYDENRRIYLPQEDLERFGVGEEHFAQQTSDAPMQALMRFEIERTRRMMLEGAPLGQSLRGRFGLEIRLIVQGGLTILERLEANLPEVFARPRLRRLDYLRMLTAALFRKYPVQPSQPSHV